MKTSKQSTSPQLDKLLRYPEVIRATGYSRSSIKRLELEGKFPKRVMLGERAVAWYTSDIKNWIETRQQFVRGKK